MKQIISILITILITTSVFAQDAFLGSWSGKLSVGQTSLTIVFNLSDDGSGSYICTMDSPDQGAKGIKAEATISDDSALEIKIPSIGAMYKGIYFNNSFVGNFTQMGADFPLTLTKGQKETLNRPQTPKEPFPYSQQEVTFTNEKAGATLAGTLITPQNASKNTPVVLMISGSGLQNRDEEVFEHKPFLVIADYLARNGIATLRYDDRGTGESKGGEIANATTLDFYEDALAGVAFLRGKGSFGKVGALGHSEGASIAFMLGAKEEADFVISLAGIGVKGDEALTDQTNRIIEIQGGSQKITTEMYRSNVMAQGNPWLVWFINYDPIPDIKACKCPVFAANGDKDIQVISSQNLTSIKDNLPQSKNNFVKEYTSLNHLFQHCTTGDISEYRQIEETYSEELLSDLSHWINGFN